MHGLRKLAASAFCISLGMGVFACGDDDDNPGTGGTSGAGGSTGGTGGGTGGTGGGTGGTGGGAGGTGGSDGSGGTTGSGGSAGATGCDLSGADKPKMEIPRPTGNLTLTSNTVWTLSDETHVASGETLTIEPCTRIEGTTTPLGTLVVERGGRIVADGTRDEPILFTSAGVREAGAWGGVILLGSAPNWQGADVQIEGLQPGPGTQYGGTDPAYNCGSMKFVRIEFTGFEISPGNEINGLTMGSCGSGTVIENVMVNTTLDDCFEWFGGGFTSKNLVCNNGGDDMFDADQGFVGTIENAFGRQVVQDSEDPNGFEMDSHTDNREPFTNVTATNVTMCGVAGGLSTSRGMVLRESLRGAFDNIVVVGFDVGVDTRDDFGTPDAPHVTIMNSVFFGNVAHNVGNAGETDNDLGFDENLWFPGAESLNNSTASPGFLAADCLAEAGPAASVMSSGKGAFAADQTWMSGLWIDWATE